MSNFSNFDAKLRSFSPQFTNSGYSDGQGLYEKHREIIHQQVSKLPNSPRSKNKIEQTFEEMLKSIHFFRKPDIIPFPYLHSEVLEEPTESTDHKYKTLLEELERERNLRKAAEKENDTLRDKLAYLSEIESQYELYRLESLKITDLTTEIEKLNLKIKLLQEENEDLRKKMRSTYDSSLNLDRYSKELERQKEINNELLKQLAELRSAYEELRKTYTKDLNSQKFRNSKLTEEKNELEAKFRETQEKLMSFRDLPQDPDDEIQAKIRSMKSEYRDKLKSLEKRLPSGRFQDESELRLKEIEDRLANLQGKLVEKEPRARVPGSQTSRGSTPAKGRSSPGTTWKTSDRFSPQKLPRSGNSIPDKVNAGSVRSPGRGKVSPARQSRSPSQNARTSGASRTSRSPGRSGSPFMRSASGHRLTEQHVECETCVRRHGHEWARSPHSPR